MSGRSSTKKYTSIYKVKSELEQLHDYDDFIDQIKDQVMEMDYLDDEEEAGITDDRKALIQKISLSNQTILAQLERLTKAALD